MIGRVVGAVFVAALVSSFPLRGAEAQGILSVQQVDRLLEPLARGNVIPVRSLMSSQCPAFELSLDESRSIGERADSARAALACARAVGATAVALAPPDRAFQVQQAVEAFVAPIQENAKVQEAKQNFLGLSWGVGVGVSMAMDDAISEAEIVDGTVRVTTEARERPRVLLESHKYFLSDANARWGFGPFVAASAANDKLLSGAGFGLMAGWRNQASDNEGFSVGVGALLDADVKDLGDGFTPGGAPPGGATSVRYTTKGRWSWVVFVTRTF